MFGGGDDAVVVGFIIPRKLSLFQNPPSRPLACAIMDLVVEFIQSHMMKQFPMELYVMALAVAQRLLCYEKRFPMND